MKNILTIAAVSLLAGLVGFTFYHLANKDSSSAETLATGVVSEPQATGSMPMATTLPEFSLKNSAGEMTSIRSWPGKSMIINFWATWCIPCRREIPMLNEIAKTEAKGGFQVVGIAVDFADSVQKFTEETKIEYPLMIGEQDGLAAANAFGVEAAGLPFTIFTDNQGRIVTMLLGELTGPKAKIVLDAVKQVNKGELTPETARAGISTQFLKLPPAKG